MKRFLTLFLMLFCVSGGALANEALFRDSTVGVDFNFISALDRANSGQPYIAGTLTYANTNKNWELAAPFFYTQYKINPVVCCEVHVKRIDLQLRRYFKENQTGLYVGLVARYSDVIGRASSNTYRKVSFTRKGAGVVVGLKTFVYKNIYWGTNFHYGTFFDDPQDLADGDAIFDFVPSEIDSSFFFNVEILKIGLRF